MCMRMGVGVGDVCVLESGCSVRGIILVNYNRQIQNNKLKLYYKQNE